MTKSVHLYEAILKVLADMIEAHSTVSKNCWRRTLDLALPDPDLTSSVPEVASLSQVPDLRHWIIDIRVLLLKPTACEHAMRICCSQDNA